MKIIIYILFALTLSFSFSDVAFAQKKTKKQKQTQSDAKPTEINAPVMNKSVGKVTFIELGSDKCIPCKQMQPIIKSIEKKYGEQVKVIFYDVWKDDAPGKQYGIKLIPTQIFLDENGKEFKRHEGFFPEKEIDKILQEKGVKPITN